MSTTLVFFKKIYQFTNYMINLFFQIQIQIYKYKYRQTLVGNLRLLSPLKVSVKCLRARQIGHINEIRLKNNSNALYKHLVLKHPGQNAKFRVEILKKFMDPLSRQVDEGIRIVKVNPSLILNSKSEFNHPPITRIKIDRRKR